MTEIQEFPQISRTLSKLMYLIMYVELGLRPAEIVERKIIQTALEGEILL